MNTLTLKLMTILSLINPLMGYTLTTIYQVPISDLDQRVSNYKFDEDEILEVNQERKVGKKQKNIR